MADGYVPLRDGRAAPFLPLGAFNGSSGSLGGFDPADDLNWNTGGVNGGDGYGGHRGGGGGRTERFESGVGALFTRRRCNCLRFRVLREFKPANFKYYHLFACVLQAVFALAVAYLDGKRIVPSDSGELHTTTTFAVLGCLQAVNLCAALFFLLVVVAQMRSLTTRQTWGFFLSMMVAFAGMYFFVAIVIDHACNSTDSRLQLPAFQFPTAWNTNATGGGGKVTQKCGLSKINTHMTWPVFMDFLYFSVTTQTLVGFGDIAPVHPVARALSVVQQLVGLFFAMVIVSMTLGTLRAHKAADAAQQRLSRRSSTGGLGTKLLGRAIAKRRAVVLFRRFARRWLLVITVVLQAVHFCIMGYADPKMFHRLEKGERMHEQGRLLAGFSVAVQAVLLGIVVMTSFKYVKHSERITLNFLCQSFLSICIHFSGIYVMTYMFEGERGWPQIKIEVAGDKSMPWQPDESYWATVVKFLYFSTTIMTTTGYGDLSPHGTLPQLAVCSEMLLSAFYLQIILALGVSLVSTVDDDGGNAKDAGTANGSGSGSGSGRTSVSATNGGRAEEGADGAHDLTDLPPPPAAFAAGYFGGSGVDEEATHYDTASDGDGNAWPAV